MQQVINHSPHLSDNIYIANDAQRREDLALAYNIFDHLKADDLTYTHLSIRSESGNSYFIYPFGMLFSEVTPTNLLEVDLNGNVLSGEESQYNITGYNIHGSIYQARPDLQAVFHLHTPEIVAVSNHKQGLLPISQWAMHFYDGVAYHDYDSLALDANHRCALTDDLGKKFTMLLKHHGSITCGRSVYEAMFFSYHLLQACKSQVASLSMGEHNINHIPADVCKKTNADLLSFEANLGLRDWKAFKRMLS